MCVRLVNDRFVLRFTFLLAVRLGLPRPASQVIHRSELLTELRNYCRDLKFARCLRFKSPEPFFGIFHGSNSFPPPRQLSHVRLPPSKAFSGNLLYDGLLTSKPVPFAFAALPIFHALVRVQSFEVTTFCFVTSLSHFVTLQLHVC